MYQNGICFCISWFPVKTCWWLMSAYLKGCVNDSHIFWIFFSQDITVPSFIIVGYVWQILGRGIFEPPPPLHPWAAPKSPTLNRVKSCSKTVMQFFFSKVAAYNLTKKELRQRFFPVKFVKIFRTVFNIATFDKWFCIFQAFTRFYQCFYVTLL